MSEANTRTKSAFAESVNSVNLIEATQVGRSSSDADDEIIAAVIVPASEAENPQSLNFLAFSNWVEPTENNMSALTQSERLELVALIQELRSSNSNLLKRVLQLEQALTECQNGLQSYKKRSRDAESMLNQQTQELASALEQVRCLCRKLEASHRTAQRQQILIEDLTAQLESSQERVTCLEREYSLTQASYNEQAQQLMQSEDTCRELRTRLTRQQRHNQPQPIRPWSAQPQSLTNELEQENTQTEGAPEIHLSPEETSEAEETEWEDLLNLLDPVEEPVTANSPEAVTVAPSRSYNAPAQLDNPFNESEPALRHSLDTNSPNSNWPSPVIYPLRPSKGRKSLAAIELPKFTTTRVASEEL